MASIAASGRTARADSIDTCKAAADDGEARRAESKLRAARERFLSCSREACPAVIRDACIQSFTEVERVLPTVVVRARDARGQDVLGVRVLIDGEPVLDRLTGKAIAADPGPHRFRYEAASGDAREEQVLVAQGERDRLLHVTFDAVLEPDGTRPRAPRVEPGATIAAPSLPLAAIVATAGVGVAGLGAFTALQLGAWGDYRALVADGCGVTRACDAGGVRAKLIGGDVALGTGIASLGVAIGLGVARLRGATAAPGSAKVSRIREDARERPPTVAPILTWQPRDGAGFAGLRGTF